MIKLLNDLEIEVLSYLDYKDIKSIKSHNYMRTINNITYVIMETIFNSNDKCILLIIGKYNNVLECYLISKIEANKIVKHYGVF